MKRITTIFFQAFIVALGIGVLGFMLWEPHIEGRNVHATLFQIYFNDPFLAYAYTASIAFFVGLYQAFTLFGYIGHNKISSPNSVKAFMKALRIIKYCALLLIALIAAPVAYLCIVRPGDDIAGGVAIGLALIFLSAIVAIVAAMCEKKCKVA